MNVKPALYAVNVSPLLQNDGLFAKARAAVTEKRREKADRYRRREDAALSLSAELLLRYAYAQAKQPFPKEFLTSPGGKPFSSDSPLCFSLSHSGEWALCAVANGEVGCDVEKIDAAHLRVAERFYTTNEQAQLAAADTEEERVLRFFRMWTLKESFIKAADRRLDSVSEQTVTLGDPSYIEGASATFAEYTELPGYACAACSYSGEELPPLQILELRDLL